MRVPTDCNLAEMDPSGFASILMEKLLKVKADQEKMDLLECSLKSIQVSLELFYRYKYQAVVCIVFRLFCQQGRHDADSLRYANVLCHLAFYVSSR